ncbi:MAG TPA: DinB family protein [Acidimicrobiales bacterium]
MAANPPRVDPPRVAGERTMLDGWLDYHRATLLTKCEGLAPEELARASVPPSRLTLLGLVRHMALVEWWWFEHIFASGPQPEPINTEHDHDADFNEVVPEGASDALELFVRQCAHSRAITAEAESLDVLSTSPERETRDLRWIMVHMIEEYARHNGHADLLRECIDGVVGD